EVVKCKYDSYFYFSEGLSSAEIDGKFGYIDDQGNEVIPVIYDMATSFEDGMAMVQKNGKFGFIDKQGNEIIPIVYESEDIRDRFDNSELALVGEYNDYKGYMD